MRGNPIEAAKKTMHTFIGSLPLGCQFNLIKFGNSFVSLFPTSKILDESSLKEARSAISSTGADLGGTEILPVFQFIFGKKSTENTSRTIFVLTDGEVSNRDSVISVWLKFMKYRWIFQL